VARVIRPRRVWSRDWGDNKRVQTLERSSKPLSKKQNGGRQGQNEKAALLQNEDTHMLSKLTEGKNGRGKTISPRGDGGGKSPLRAIDGLSQRKKKQKGDAAGQGGGKRLKVFLQLPRNWGEKK